MKNLIKTFDFPSSFSDGLSSILDILIIAILIYYAYQWLKDTRAVPVVIGLMILTGISILARLFQLETLEWLFDALSAYMIIAIIVTLQPEMRRIFYRIGKIGWLNYFFQARRNININPIIKAVSQMKKEKIGALIILLNQIDLNQLKEGGIELDAKISKELLVSIFYGENPLHDGAILIENDKILYVATYLPMSTSPQLKKTHGARHRAALGIAEESDALAIIVSEEKKKGLFSFFRGTARKREPIYSTFCFRSF